ncbi:TfuA-like protein [Streptomyces sp. NPDC057654]|uniref:TfuA-like protein n=1 Tax=Streptomyces sp. NPDC057654 TaxID=3346196 RepID=UPI0036A95085
MRIRAGHPIRELLSERVKAVVSGQERTPDRPDDGRAPPRTTLRRGRIRTTSLLPGAVCHPPVRHGDLLQLAAGPGDTVVIIDGLWHQCAPVRHKEILVLLDSGVRVLGTASMGALRAAELAPYGMIGIGRIYEDFRTGALEADDEVAVLHTPDGRALTEALVNLRTAIRRAAASDRITDAQARDLQALAVNCPTPAGLGPPWPALPVPPMSPAPSKR